MTGLRRLLATMGSVAVAVTLAMSATPEQQAPLQGVPPVADAATYAPLATRIDPYVPKPRVVVLTDIANEPDDQMSFVRLLVSSNQFDIEGLVATTSRHLRTAPRPDVLRSVLEAYGKVQPNLAKHEAGFPTAEALSKLVTAGQDSYGMAAVGAGRMTPGAEAIVRAADATDPRPVWISIWGGANTLAQALWQIRSTRSAADVEKVVAKLVVAGQDSYGMAAVGEGRMTAGAEAIVRAADSNDPRPLWVSIWGGANTLAQAL